MENKEKKKILRFRFIIVFAVLLLIAMFVLYMVQTSLEDVLKQNNKEEQKATDSAPSYSTDTTTTTTTSEITHGSDVVTITTPVQSE